MIQKKMTLASLIYAWLILLVMPYGHAACAPKSIAVDQATRGEIVCLNEEVGVKMATPLVLAFNGRGSNAAEMAATTQIHKAWPKAIVVYLDGLIRVAKALD